MKVGMIFNGGRIILKSMSAVKAVPTVSSFPCIMNAKNATIEISTGVAVHTVSYRMLLIRDFINQSSSFCLAAKTRAIQRSSQAKNFMNLI